MRISGRLLVMGDVHGQYAKMHKVLELSGYDPARDQLILLGDYVDRGPESNRVLEKVRLLVKLGAVALYGNHEEMMRQAMKNRRIGRMSSNDLEQWYANGGEITLASYRAQSSVLDKHLSFLGTLPRWHEEQGFLFVHAGFRPGVGMAQQAPQDLIWIREPYILGYEGPQDVVTGHTPTQFLARYASFHDKTDFSKPVLLKHKIFIDTGAAWGGPLTVVELPSLKFWQA